MEKITTDELDYLQKLLRDRETALGALRAVDAASASFGAHLSGKYKLAEGDKIGPDGAILRAAAQ
jgi:hypothetical protein